MDSGYCEYVIDYGSRYIDPEPDELCGDETEPGEIFCETHLSVTEGFPDSDFFLER